MSESLSKEKNIFYSTLQNKPLISKKSRPLQKHKYTLQSLQGYRFPSTVKKFPSLFRVSTAGTVERHILFYAFIQTRIVT